ncbi:hypothetical protein JNB91_16365 [Rhizobium wenxiniae]|uniref:hypothetical protein n=1 Tax=Rhizobium wenxiniae TaxID=1737357 RepID=UPI001C6EE1F0|nr:hypothetical protein [Rhizobium wenxiniae]MBW9089408.1 hypothetical protein [Rhizobium wenxiniae]
MSMLVVYVARLVPLWKERYDVVDAIMEARREERTLSVDRLVEERTKIDSDINVLGVKERGFDPKAVEIVGRETMETPKQREKRVRFNLVLDLYRKDLAENA